jgi:hypothetical protein
VDIRFSNPLAIAFFSQQLLYGRIHVGEVDRGLMAQLPEETTTVVLELQRQLLVIIHQATAVSFLILERYGETETTLTDLEQLDNTRERADTY